MPEAESIIPSPGGRTLVRNMIWNLIGQGAPLFVALFAIPLLIKGLGTERFGVLVLAWMVVGYFTLFDLGIGRATTKYTSEYLAKRAFPTLCLFPLREVNLTRLRSRGFILFFTTFLSWVLLEKELVFHHFAEDMSDENVNLLNAGCAGGGDNEGNIYYL